MNGCQDCRRALNEWWNHTWDGGVISLPLIKRNGFQYDSECTECRELNEILGECDLVYREASQMWERNAENISSETTRLFNKLQSLRERVTAT